MACIDYNILLNVVSHQAFTLLLEIKPDFFFTTILYHTDFVLPFIKPVFPKLFYICAVLKDKASAYYHWIPAFLQTAFS